MAKILVKEKFFSNCILGPRRITNEPLKRFTEAKKVMGELYNELGKYVEELANFYNSKLFL